MTNPTLSTHLTPHICAETVKELLESGETYKARQQAMQAIEFFGEDNIDGADLQVFAATLLFDVRFDDDKSIRRSFAHLWAPTWDTYSKGYDQREYLGRLLWVSELLIRNGLGGTAYWLLQSEISTLWSIMREATSQLLERYKSSPGFEIFYRRIQPMLRTPGPTTA